MLLVPVEFVPVQMDLKPLQFALNVVVLLSVIAALGLAVFGIYQFYLQMTNKSKVGESTWRVISGIFLLLLVFWGTNLFIGGPSPADAFGDFMKVMTEGNIRDLLPTPVP